MRLKNTPKYGESGVSERYVTRPEWLPGNLNRQPTKSSGHSLYSSDSNRRRLSYCAAGLMRVFYGCSLKIPVSWYVRVLVEYVPRLARNSVDPQQIVEARKQGFGEDSTTQSTMLIARWFSAS